MYALNRLIAVASAGVGSLVVASPAFAAPAGIDLTSLGTAITDGLGQGIALMLVVGPTAVLFSLLPAIAKKALRMVA